MKTNSILNIFIVLALGTLLLLSSCEKLKGEGGNVIYSPEVNYFHSLDIDIPCNISISYGDSVNFTIEAQQNILDNIYMYVESNILHLESSQKFYDSNPITLTITMPDLLNLDIKNISDATINSTFHTTSRMRIDISGTSHIIFTDSISCSDFLFSNTGFSSLNIKHISCSRNFDLSSKGISDIDIKGKALSSTINVDGELSFEGLNFITETTNISIAGHAKPVKVHATKELNIDVTGSASVKYKGTPQIIIEDSKGELEIVPAN